ncbi:MAG: translocation/assembly module TamB domain-containing protein [Myxococcales bacterium]|nr:translocation/assembly module TamB domain-containing protein [Myxococcales bacterium]
MTLLLLVISVLASALFHVQMPMTRRIVASLVGQLVNGEIKGRLHISHIDVLALHKVVTRDVSLYDQAGRRVAFADQVTLFPDLGAAVGGVVRFAHVRLNHARVHLFETPSGLPSLIAAFEPKDPTPGIGPPLHAIVDDIQLGDVTASGDILGLKGLHVEHFKARWRLEARRDIDITVYTAKGVLIEPFAFPARLLNLHGRVSSKSVNGIQLKARASMRGEHYAASIGYASKDPTSDSELDIVVRADRATGKTLEGLGFAWARLIKSKAAGSLRLVGPTDNLALQGHFRTDGGTVDLKGVLREDTTTIGFKTDHIELDKVLLEAPAVTTSGAAQIVLKEGPSALALDLGATTYNDLVFPAFTLRGRLLEEEVVIDRLHSEHLGGHIYGKGRIDFDGRVRLELDVNVKDVKNDPNLPHGLSSGLKASVSIDTQNPVTHDLEVHGHGRLERFRYQNTAADDLVVEGRFRGRPRQPDINVHATGTGLSVSGYPITLMDIVLKGGPDHYTAKGVAESGSDRKAEFEATIEASSQSYLIQADSIRASAGSETWRGSINGLVYTPEHSVSVERIVLANGSQRLEIVGSYRFHDSDDLEANLQDFDLRGLNRLLGRTDSKDLEGRVDVHATMRGEMRDPELLLEGALRDAHIAGINSIEAVYVVQYANSVIEYDAQAEVENKSMLTLSGTGQVELDVSHFVENLKRGTYQAQASIDELPLSTVKQVSHATFGGTDGVLTAKFSGAGTVGDFALDGSLRLTELSVQEFRGFEARATFNYGDRTLLATLELHDVIGKLLSAEGAFHIDPMMVASQPSLLLKTVWDEPWQLSARLTPRQFAQMPHPFPSLPYFGTFGAKCTLHGNAQETVGRLVVDTAFTGDNASGRKPSRLKMVANLDDSRVYATFNGSVDRRRVLKAEAYAPLTLHDWIRRPARILPPPVRFTGHVWRMPLEGLPFASQNSSGPLDVSWDAKDLFTAHPSLDFSLKSHALRFFDTEPIAVNMHAKTTPRGISATATTKDVSGGSSQIQGHVPIRWSNQAPFLYIERTAPVSLKARFHNARLQPILTVVPSIENADAIAVGTLNVGGTLEHLTLGGTVNIHQGHLQVVGLGQQLTDVKGKVIFNGNWAQLIGLRAVDGRGHTQIQGGIGFEGIQPKRVRLSLNAWKFPVRREGSILATLSGNARFSAQLASSHMDAKLRIADLSVALPDDTTSGVQPLEPHPDLVVNGVATGAEDEEDEPFVAHMKIDASQPFWVRRSDFAIQVASELDITYEKTELYIEGYSKLRRGYFDLFGKNFSLQRGTLSFDGSSELNPEVNLQAMHEVSSRTGVSVTMTVDGRLQSPTVEFTSTHPDCQERSQVIDLLVSGRCSGSDRGGNTGAAEEQTASFLAGITAGILTLGARREFGDLIPVISIETGQGGFASTRARLGYQADTFIPDFMKPIVTGAYVEGAFPLATSDEQAQQQQKQQQYQQQGSGTRFLLELQFPYNFVGTTQYWPPGTWGLDLTWEP